MQLHEEFEWDDEKAADNLQRHGVSFDDAARFMADPDADLWHVDLPDVRHDYNEDRWVTLATDPAERNLLFRCLDRADAGGSQHNADHFRPIGHTTGKTLL